MDLVSAIFLGGLFVGGNWLYSKITGTDYKDNVKKSREAIKNKARELSDKASKNR